MGLGFTDIFLPLAFHLYPSQFSFAFLLHLAEARVWGAVGLHPSVTRQQLPQTTTPGSYDKTLASHPVPIHCWVDRGTGQGDIQQLHSEQESKPKSLGCEPNVLTTAPLSTIHLCIHIYIHMYTPQMEEWSNILPW